MAFGGETPESYYDEGVTASMRGDLAEAIKHFERAAELDQAFVGAYHQLGKCYSRLGEPGKAMQYLQHVIRAKPNQIPPRVDFAYALLDSGDYEGARKLFDEVVSAKPDNQRAQRGFAYCAFQEGNWEAAMNLAQNVVRRRPRRARRYVCRSNPKGITCGVAFSLSARISRRPSKIFVWRRRNAGRTSITRPMGNISIGLIFLAAGGCVCSGWRGWMRLGKWGG